MLRHRTAATARLRSAWTGMGAAWNETGPETRRYRSRPQLPNFLLKIPDYGLYSHDVEFINHHLRLHTRGRVLYQLAVSLCRAVVFGYFAGVRMEVLALTRHPELGCIRARWRLVGVPFHLCLLRFYRRDKRDLLRSVR
ncbi:uncharacterized protein C6orf136 homolog [Coturnix japonica]|uniref:uncharacterized protein C6orf136 homolog n=1 Tax=Coturnix japonica TaxID=93934 RepID=UPI000777F1E1|nr:uncharacterized protein C6orf136 homolog [Coturnix japonica]